MNQENTSPFRDKIAYILGHEIIYSTQYQSIEFGRSNEQLERFVEKEMGSFAEWASLNKWKYGTDGLWFSLDEGNDNDYTTEELIKLYYQSIKG